ncbi:MAG: helix-turn-helix domain-containing protein [bacterium]|nr:helix-turn-helix domain-containing protein [bacterium]
MTMQPTDNSGPSPAVGLALRDGREKKGMTVEQLAEQSGCFGSTIEKIELGEILPDREQLQKLGDALGLDSSELFTLLLSKPSPDTELYSGADIRRARKAMGLTQQQLAALSECCGRTVSSFELGKNRPQRRVLNAIVKVLGDYLSDVAPGKVSEANPKAAKSKSKKKAKLPPPAHIGEKIKRAREAKDISQEQLAESIGAYPYTIAWIERGKERPTPELEEAIWEALESDMSKPEVKAHRGDTSGIFTSGKNLLRDLLSGPGPEGGTAEITSLIGGDPVDSSETEIAEQEAPSPLISQPIAKPAEDEADDTPAKTIAQAVKQARMRAGLTPQDVAQLEPSCPSGMLAYIEAGFKKPTRETAKALALALKVDPEEFYAFLD